MNSITKLNDLSPSKKEQLIEKFLEIWKQDNVHSNYMASNVLSDDEYILYSAWCQLNDERLYRTLTPEMSITSGSVNRTDKIVFHGGCQPCESQHIHGIIRCKGCQYFRAEWGKPDLSKDEIPNIPQKTGLFGKLLGI